MTIHHYVVLDGRFGIDGLESSWPVFQHESADECYRHMVENRLWDHWVEARDENDKFIWVNEPYPRRLDAEVPEWFKTAMHDAWKADLEQNAARFSYETSM